MSKEGVIKQLHDLHNQQDRELADKIGAESMDHMAGVNSKIPLRVTSETIQQGTQTVRKESVVKK